MLLTCVDAVHRSHDYGLWDGAGNWEKQFIGMEHQVFEGVIGSLSSSWCCIVVDIVQYEVLVI